MIIYSTFPLFRVRFEIGESVSLNSVLYWFSSLWTKAAGFPIETFGNDVKGLDPGSKAYWEGD